MGTAEKLLDAAEHRMRSGGFHAVSFRDLADDLSIKSASVHYYFRHKEDLGAAVVARYRDRFLADLDARIDGADDPKARVEAMVEAFRAALSNADQVCLCGVMGAESLGLPEPVRKEVAAFMVACVDWLADGYKSAGHPPDRARARALTLIAALEGAMILAVATADDGAFDVVADQLLRQA